MRLNLEATPRSASSSAGCGPATQPSAPAVPDFESSREGDVDRLRSALVSAGAPLPAAFEKVTIHYIADPDAAWSTRGPAGEPPVMAVWYKFKAEFLRDVGPVKAAAAAALLPRGCSVKIDGCAMIRTQGSVRIETVPGAVLPAAAVAEALAGRQIKRLTFEDFSNVGPRLASAIGAAGAEHLELSMGLTDEGSAALAQAVASSVAGGSLRRLGFSVSNIAQRLTDLGAALQKIRAGPSLELELEEFNKADAAAVYAALAAMLDRVSHLRLETIHAEYTGAAGARLVVRSPTLRRLELRFKDGDWPLELEGMPFQLDAAPALESVRLERVFPCEAALLLAALASDPDLPALRSVEMTLSEAGYERYWDNGGPLAPIADQLRALEELAPAAAGGAGAAEGGWQVDVERETTMDKTYGQEWERELIRAWRR